MIRCPSPIARELLAIAVLFLVSPRHGARGAVHGSSAGPSSLQHVALEENLAQSRLNVETDETKRQMLNVLGIDELPEPRHGIVPHQYMMHIYQKMSTRKSDYKGVNTIRGFVDVGDADRSSGLKFHQIYTFNISALPVTEKIISANLRLLRLPSQQEWRYAWAHGTQYRAKLYYRKTTKHMWNGRLFSHTRLQLLGSVVFDIKESVEKWKVFNVMDALRTWQNGTNLVHNFELQVESVKSGYLMPSYAFGLSEHGRTHYQRALLVSFTDDGRTHVPEVGQASGGRTRSRKRATAGGGGGGGRRRARNGDAQTKERGKREARRRRRRKPLCSRKKLYVDFKALGWSNFIIAPTGYEAYYCQGYCKFPIPAHLKPTNHALVQTTVNSVEERRRVPPACCVPHKLSALGMLFIGKGDSVVYKKFDNMAVESCGCK